MYFHDFVLSLWFAYSNYSDLQKNRNKKIMLYLNFFFFVLVLLVLSSNFDPILISIEKVRLCPNCVNGHTETRVVATPKENKLVILCWVEILLMMLWLAQLWRRKRGARGGCFCLLQSFELFMSLDSRNAVCQTWFMRRCILG